MNSLLTNESSMIALSTLRQINKDLTMVQQEISTGKSVSNARDNAAIWAVSTVMQSDVDSFEAISDSLSLGASTVAVARGAAEQVTDLLQEMKGLIVAAQEDNVDRDKIQTDVDQLTEQIDTIVGAAQFNGLNLLSGSGSIDILASLDRAADGTVSASDISISGRGSRAFAHRACRTPPRPASRRETPRPRTETAAAARRASGSAKKGQR